MKIEKKTERQLILGERLKSAMGYRGKSVRDVAAKLGVSHQTIYSLTSSETKEPDLYKIMDIAEYLDVSILYLLGYSVHINRNYV